MATPEHDRLAMAKRSNDATQVLGDFLEWLGEQGYFLGQFHDHGNRFVPADSQANDRLVAEFFGIDLRKLDEEKRAILAAVRAFRSEST